jgi:hypothetical protein
MHDDVFVVFSSWEVAMLRHAGASGLQLGEDAPPTIKN